MQVDVDLAGKLWTPQVHLGAEVDVDREDLQLDPHGDKNAHVYRVEERLPTEQEIGVGDKPSLDSLSHTPRSACLRP